MKVVPNMQTSMTKLEALYLWKAQINQEIKALKARIYSLEQEKARLYPEIEQAEKERR